MKTPAQIEFLDAFEFKSDCIASNADRLRAAATAVANDRRALVDYSAGPVSESHVRMQLAKLDGQDEPYTGLTYAHAAKLTLNHLDAGRF